MLSRSRISNMKSSSVVSVRGFARFDCIRGSRASNAEISPELRLSRECGKNLYAERVGVGAFFLIGSKYRRLGKIRN